MTDTPTTADLFRELVKLAALNGISGHEQDVTAYLRTVMEPLADEIEIDSIGNLYAIRRGGSGPHIMISAHSDEIGALVSAIESDGYIRLQPVGGVSEILMLGRKVLVGGHRGVVGVRPGHLQSPQESRTAPEFGEMYIDLGLESSEEVAALGVRIGDQITWQSELQPVANSNRVIGKAIDNRISCLVLIELLRWLQGQDLPGTLTAVVAVQEEVGLKGARIAAERVRPDLAVVVDTVPCADTPDSRHVRTFPVKLGRGPVIQVSSGPRGSGYLMPEPLRNYLIQVAEDAGIPYQLAAFSYGNTDAGSVYTSAGGIPTVPITMPRRYSHSPVEMLDLNDALATLRLIQEVVRRVEAFAGH